MRLLDTTGGICPNEIRGQARQLYNQAVTAEQRPSRRAVPCPNPDRQADQFLIIVELAAVADNDRVLIINTNPFRIVSAVENTVIWTGGTAPFTVSTCDLYQGKTGTMVNVDLDFYTIEPGIPREFTVMKIDDIDGWWAADDEPDISGSSQKYVGVLITDALGRELFAPFGGLLRDGTEVYGNFGPGTWCEPTLHWINPDPIVYGIPLSATQLNASVNIPGTTEPLPGTYSYTPPSEMILDADTYSLAVLFEADDADHYHPVTMVVSLVVNKADQFFSGGGVSPNGDFMYVGEITQTAIYDYHISGNPLTITGTPGVVEITDRCVLYDDPTPGHEDYPVTHFTVSCLAPGSASVVETLEGSKNYNPYSKTFSWGDALTGTMMMTGSGGAVVGGEATTVQWGGVFVGAGGAVGAGEASVGRYNLVIGGYGACCGGAAVVIVNGPFVGSMEAVAGGEAVLKVSNRCTGSGGSVASGAAMVTSNALFVGSGGALAAGVAIVTGNPLFVGSGGALVAGAAIVAANPLCTGFGGGLVGGDAVVSGAVTYVGTGGIIAAGEAITNILQFKVIIGQGGAVAAGTAVATSQRGVQITLLGLSQTYDGSPHEVTATTVPADLPVTITYDGDDVPPIDAGQYHIEATYDDGEYTGQASGTLTVARVPLTISAQNTSKTYDGFSWSGGSVTYAGFIAGETAGVLSGIMTYGGTAQGAVNAGTYSIVPYGVYSPNYNIAFVSGVLTVYQALPDITFTLPAAITEGEILSQYKATSNIAGITFTYHDGSPTGALIDMDGPQVFNTGLAIFAVTDASQNYASTSAWAGVVVMGLPEITWDFALAAATYGYLFTELDLTATAVCHGTVLEPLVFTATDSNGAIMPLTVGTKLTGGMYVLKASYAGSGLYVANFEMKIFVINKADPVLTWISTFKYLRYPYVLTASDLNATADIPGTFVYKAYITINRITKDTVIYVGYTLPPGQYYFRAIFTPADSVNYNVKTIYSNLYIIEKGLITTAVLWTAGANTVGEAGWSWVTGNVSGGSVYYYCATGCGTVIGEVNGDTGAFTTIGTGTYSLHATIAETDYYFAAYLTSNVATVKAAPVPISVTFATTAYVNGRVDFHGGSGQYTVAWSGGFTGMSVQLNSGLTTSTYMQLVAISAYNCYAPSGYYTIADTNDPSNKRILYYSEWFPLITNINPRIGACISDPDTEYTIAETWWDFISNYYYGTINFQSGGAVSIYSYVPNGTGESIFSGSYTYSNNVVTITSLWLVLGNTNYSSNLLGHGTVTGTGIWYYTSNIGDVWTMTLA